MYPLVVQVEAQALVVTRLSGIRHIGVFIEVYGDAGTDRRTPRLWGNSVWRWWWRVSFRVTRTYTLGLQPKRSNRAHILMVSLLSLDYYRQRKRTTAQRYHSLCTTQFLGNGRWSSLRCLAGFLMCLAISHSRKVNRQTNINATTTMYDTSQSSGSKNHALTKNRKPRNCWRLICIWIHT